ncbi:MAG: hypothetical protein V3S32_07585 [Acidimicrobiia bacterium]
MAGDTQTRFALVSGQGDDAIVEASGAFYRLFDIQLVVCRSIDATVSPSHRRHLARTHNEGAAVAASSRRTPPGVSRAGETA